MEEQLVIASVPAAKFKRRNSLRGWVSFSQYGKVFTSRYCHGYKRIVLTKCVVKPIKLAKGKGGVGEGGYLLKIR